MPVYIILADRSGAVKIGYSRNPAARLAQIKTSSPETITVLRLLEGGYELERRLHVRFSDLRIKREWFSYSDEMMGNLGAQEYIAPRKVAPEVFTFWSHEARRAAAARQNAIAADPIRREARRAKLRATRARKAEAADSA